MTCFSSAPDPAVPVQGVVVAYVPHGGRRPCQLPVKGSQRRGAPVRQAVLLEVAAIAGAIAVAR